MISSIIYDEGLYFLFKKFNRPSYQAFIPIKNSLVLLSIANKPFWWIFPILIPFIRFIPSYFVNLALAKKFGKTQAFALGMTFLPWYFYGSIGLNENTEAHETIA